MARITQELNTLTYDETLCIGCGMCAIVCPHRVFAFEGRKARLVRGEACIECGACQRNCPVGAISVRSGVGCAQAMIYAALTERNSPTCGPKCCGSGGAKGCC